MKEAKNHNILVNIAGQNVQVFQAYAQVLAQKAHTKNIILLYKKSGKYRKVLDYGKA